MSEPVILTPEPATLYRPVWADPGFIGSTNEVQVSLFTTTNAGIFLLCNNNPKRWALSLLAGEAFRIAPNPRPDLYPLYMTVKNTNISLNLFAHGPMVSYEWYVYIFPAPTPAVTISVYETDIH